MKFLLQNICRFTNQLKGGLQWDLETSNRAIRLQHFNELQCIIYSEVTDFVTTVTYTCT